MQANRLIMIQMVDAELADAIQTRPDAEADIDC